jgi:hypothetical protein
VCGHVPMCPPAASPGRATAHVVAAHPEQGWSLLCNGVVLFDDCGALLPDGSAIDPAGLCWTATAPGPRAYCDQPALSRR